MSESVEKFLQGVREPRDDDYVVIHWQIKNGSGRGHPILMTVAKQAIALGNRLYGEGTHWAEAVSIEEELKARGIK